MRIWCPIKPLVHFHKCFVSCVVEYPDNIYTLYKSNDGLPGYNVNASDDKQLDFRCLKEFYIIIFLNKLKIVENKKKIW